MLRFLTAWSLVITSGCVTAPGASAPPPPPPQVEYVWPQFLAVLSEGVTIRAEDGAWSLSAADEPIPPPFRSASLDVTFPAPGLATRTEGGEEWYFLAEGTMPLGDGQMTITTYGRPYGELTKDAGRLLDLYDVALARNARRVRVQVPGREKPLYGVLALGPCVEGAQETSPKRSYRIQVPPARVEQALGAQVALVYQPYRAEVPGRLAQLVVPSVRHWRPDRGTTPVPVERVTWMLWISDAPFAGHAPD